MIRNDASQRQVDAANPQHSTWLSANAGSGKTRVLTDRVARLLLGGTDPQRILCLTYTKAAASEMQNRLFRRLGDWAMRSNDELADILRTLGVESTIDTALLATARRLFAQAIETPGGLKIQTIHSFCASLLRRFPLEAGVSPQFTEMDDRAARRLRQEIADHIANGPEAALFEALASHLIGDLDPLLAEIAKHRARFDPKIDAKALWALLDLPDGYGHAHLLADVWEGTEDQWWPSLMAALEAGSKTDQSAANKLRGVIPGGNQLGALEGALLKGESAKEPFSAKIGSFPTKATRAKLSDIADALDGLMERVQDARPRRLALAAAEKAQALHGFARVFLRAYESRKQQQGWLDFDDLILRSRDLLSDRGVAEWVLYRLDGGLDHILVDEAQDTSPEQWQVIELLAQEFTAGQGAQDRLRTIFVVGDKKQSIYSFQGADPDGFDRMKAQFRTGLAEGPTPLADLQLEYSFRSSQAILSLVDACFPPHDRAGLGLEMLHRAFRTDLPGRVDLWPAIAANPDPDPPHWSDPVDLLAPQHHAVQLAETIAAEIRQMIASGTALMGENGPRPLSCGDILILVQRRGDLFHELIRACKAQGLDVAGADRLKLGGELAVRDLVALLSFLATPEDSLSLAVVLRSPLFGWDEAQLYDLAAHREETFLWARFRNHICAETETYKTLDALRDEADFLRPFELLERILTRHDGRRRLIARLGAEAEDGIDALLSLALSYEQGAVPSLTGFLTWLQSEEVEIKRQLDSGGDQIRVMTVHGSKGLEAPVVILPDTADRMLQMRDQLLPGPDGTPLWALPAAESPPALADARADWNARQEQERQRLLYVATTRAEQWLIVAAGGKTDKDDCWYNRITRAMEHAGATPHDFPLGQGKRLAHGNWPAPMQISTRPKTAEHDSLPEWSARPAPPPLSNPPLIAPSALGGAKALAGEAGLDEEAAMARGTQIHLLLEHLAPLPIAAHAERAQAMLPELDHAVLETLLTEVTAVLAAPDLKALFAPGTLAEVPVTANLPGLGQMLGVIDRLLISSERVLAVDFKTNATVPTTPEQVPEGLLRQMGAYQVALRQIYPDRRVETALLWTRTATLMTLPDALITHALQNAGSLDAMSGAS